MNTHDNLDEVPTEFWEQSRNEAALELWELYANEQDEDELPF